MTPIEIAMNTRVSWFGLVAAILFVTNIVFVVLDIRMGESLIYIFFVCIAAFWLLLIIRSYSLVSILQRLVSSSGSEEYVAPSGSSWRLAPFKIAVVILTLLPTVAFLSTSYGGDILQKDPPDPAEVLLIFTGTIAWFFLGVEPIIKFFAR